MATKETLASRREKLEEDLKQTQRHIYDGEEAYIGTLSPSDNSMTKHSLIRYPPLY